MSRRGLCVLPGAAPPEGDHFLPGRAHSGRYGFVERRDRSLYVLDELSGEVVIDLEFSILDYFPMFVAGQYLVLAHPISTQNFLLNIRTREMHTVPRELKVCAPEGLSCSWTAVVSARYDGAFIGVFFLKEDSPQFWAVHVSNARIECRTMELCDSVLFVCGHSYVFKMYPDGRLEQLFVPQDGVQLQLDPEIEGICALYTSEGESRISKVDPSTGKFVGRSIVLDKEPFSDDRCLAIRHQSGIWWSYCLGIYKTYGSGAPAGVLGGKNYNFLRLDLPDMVGKRLYRAIRRGGDTIFWKDTIGYTFTSPKLAGALRFRVPAGQPQELHNNLSLADKRHFRVMSGSRSYFVRVPGWGDLPHSRVVGGLRRLAWVLGSAGLSGAMAAAYEGTANV